MWPHSSVSVRICASLIGHTNALTTNNGLQLNPNSFVGPNRTSKETGTKSCTIRTETDKEIRKLQYFNPCYVENLNLVHDLKVCTDQLAFTQIFSSSLEQCDITCCFKCSTINSGATCWWCNEESFPFKCGRGLVCCWYKPGEHGGGSRQGSCSGVCWGERHTFTFLSGQTEQQCFIPQIIHRCVLQSQLDPYRGGE